MGFGSSAAAKGEFDAASLVVIEAHFIERSL
jgi:hypothetical protein